MRWLEKIRKNLLARVRSLLGVEAAGFVSLAHLIRLYF